MEMKIGRIAEGKCALCGKEKDEVVTVVLPGEQSAKAFCWNDLKRMIRLKLPEPVKAQPVVNGPAVAVPAK